jgi:L-lysine 2,3-aminomutase
MLPGEDVHAIAGLLARGAPEQEVRAAARAVQTRVHPGPPGQPELTAPEMDGEPVPGLRHEDPGTVLIFPRQDQAGHAPCTCCFSWARFTGEPDPGMTGDDMDTAIRYMRGCPQVSGVVIAGADPMLMGAAALRRYLEPLLDPSLEHIESIGFATTSLGYWPQRFAGDPDAGDTLRLFEDVTAAGKTLAVMACFCHPRELEPPAAAAAAARIRAAGAMIHTQAPLVKTVNDDPRTWAAMWRAQLRLGLIPYDMVVARDTGPQGYFAVPLAAGVQIFQAAFASVSGLCRTVRGPSMQTAPGRVCVDGVTQIAGDKVFILHMIQAQDPSLVGRRFFARFDPGAVWLSDLEPTSATRFPFEPPPGLWSPESLSPVR